MLGSVTRPRSPTLSTAVGGVSSTSWISSRWRRRGSWRISGGGTCATTVPPEQIIAEGVGVALGERLLETRPMGGGCIGEVYRAKLSGGTSVVAEVDRAGES